MNENNKFLKVIDVILALAIIAIICVITLQVLGRTPLIAKSPHWTEELSRMIFVFIVSIGSISGTIRNEFVSVDLITSKIKGKANIIFNIVLDALMSLFFFVLTPACIKFVQLGGKQLSPSLRVNMKYIYVLILISIVGMGIGKIYRVFVNIKALKEYKGE